MRCWRYAVEVKPRSTSQMSLPRFSLSFGPARAPPVDEEVRIWFTADRRALATGEHVGEVRGIAASAHGGGEMLTTPWVGCASDSAGVLMMAAISSMLMYRS